MSYTDVGQPKKEDNIMQTSIHFAYVKESTQYTIDVDGQALALSRRPWGGAQVAVKGRTAFIGYLVEEDAQDPTDDDAVGKIYAMPPRDESGRLLEVLGLDIFRHPNFEHPAVQAIAAEMAARAGSTAGDLSEEQWLTAWRRARRSGAVGNPFAVRLDKYEHGAIEYRVDQHCLTGDLEKFSADAVWVPDAELEKYLYEAMFQPQGVTFGHRFDGSKNVHEVIHNGVVVGTYESFNAAVKATRDYWLGNASLAEEAYTRKAIVLLCEKYAREALEDYNEYLNGHAYGIAVDTFAIPASADPECEPTEYVFASTDYEEGYLGLNPTLTELRERMERRAGNDAAATS
ncbi:hypothetical protein F6X40_10390 [Paraburkholderia sp. UCT31]|uniref:hypothetical protein n=1 Tax=Paraburkholderia sp. UCT31 TaxID=2615209 RepID=UPI001656204C|nr:hypothetical protein [Paraburkholderia sp. UCT31]MBC8737216.1 hypothetical protein [Paraburkholderia sp. UCT31]